MSRRFFHRLLNGITTVRFHHLGWLYLALSALALSAAVAMVCCRAAGAAGAVPASSRGTEDRLDRLEDAVATDSQRLSVLEQRGSPAVAAVEIRLARLETTLEFNRNVMVGILLALVGLLAERGLALMARRRRDGWEGE